MPDFIDLTEDDALISAELDPATAERLRTQTIEGWHARKQPSSHTPNPAPASNVTQNVQTSSRTPRAALQTLTPPTRDIQNGQKPQTLSEIVHNSAPPQPAPRNRLQPLNNGTISNSVQSPPRAEDIGPQTTRLPVPLPATTNGGFSSQTFTSARPPAGKSDAVRRLYTDSGSATHQKYVIVPGQSVPYTLPPNCTRCPIPGCWNRLAYDGEQLIRLREHMNRMHGWPPPNQQDPSDAPVISIASTGLETPRETNTMQEATFPPPQYKSPTRVPHTLAGRKRSINGHFKPGDASHQNNSQQSAQIGQTQSLQSPAASGCTTTQPPIASSMSERSVELTARLVRAMENAVRNGPAVNTRTNSSMYCLEEKELLVHLKEDLELTWDEIGKYFPHRRTWHSMQSQYSGKLKNKYFPKYRAVQSGVAIHEAESAQALKKSSRLRANQELSESSYTSSPLPNADLDVKVTESSIHGKGDHWLTEVPIAKPTLIAGATRASRHPRQRLEEVTLGFVDSPAISPHTTITISPSKNGAHSDALERSQAALCGMIQKISRSPATNSPLRSDFSIPRLTNHTKKRQSVHISKPYLDKEERDFLKDSIDSLWTSETVQWNGEILHVDFTEEEIGILDASIRRLRLAQSDRTIPPASRIKETLAGANEHEIDQIALRAIWHGEFINRTVDSIKSFIRDVLNGENRRVASTQRIGYRNHRRPLSSLLRHRELGVPMSLSIKAFAHDTLGPTLMFNGTSSDVNNVAWSPDGEHFAIASAALTDPSSMQYNRPNNLLVGKGSTLWELPDHATERKASAGVNATPEMQATQDPYLFTTVSSVEFAPDKRVMLSAGYDGYVRLWELEEHRPTLAFRVPCLKPIDLVSVTGSGLFATGTKTGENAVRVWRYALDSSGGVKSCDKVAKLGSQQASDLGDEYQIEPSCLRWGPPMNGQSRYLLGGFSARDDEKHRGEILLWDIQAERLIGLSISKRNIFDVAWSPTVFGRFAFGSGAGGREVNRGTRSVVRIHDSRYLPASARMATAQMATNSHRTYEMECPATDMNDVLFNPHDDFLISAGCTDGKVYVWDLRRPDEILHQFEHGSPLVELDESRPREAVDTGVRFLSWDEPGRLLYSGSSDGVVASWNPYLAPEDAFHRKVAQLNTGVMAGSFSPDFSNLLLGDVQGCATMLSVGNEDKTLRDCDRFKHIEADKRDLAERVKRPKAENSSKDENAPPEPCEELQQTGSLIDWSDIKMIPTDSTTARVADGVDDSGAWKDRIPERYHLAPDRKDLFDCPRCGNAILIDRSTDVYLCLDCRKSWRVDILGYHLARLPGVELGQGMKAEAGNMQDPQRTLEPRRVPPHIHDLWDIDESVRRQLRIS